MGAHPGFNCKIGDYLEFDETEEDMRCEKIDSTNILTDCYYDVTLENGKAIRLTEDLFNQDALILSNLNSSVVTLKSDDHDKSVRGTKSPQEHWSRCPLQRQAESWLSWICRRSRWRC